MSDFPRGWTLTFMSTPPGSGVITIAGVPNVMHVLDAFYVRILNTTQNNSATTGLFLSSSGGTFSSLMLASLVYLPVPAVTPAVPTTDSDSDSGLNLAALAGETLTLSCSTTGGAGLYAFIRVKGYDI